VKRTTDRKTEALILEADFFHLM